ncbi:hypothetical protein EBR66_06965 [bacterium]|nr:hypothetical protein [bacterium]
MEGKEGFGLKGKERKAGNGVIVLYRSTPIPIEWGCPVKLFRQKGQRRMDSIGRMAVPQSSHERGDFRGAKSLRNSHPSHTIFFGVIPPKNKTLPNI